MDDADDLFGGLPSITKAENASAKTVGAVSSSSVVNDQSNLKVTKKNIDAPKPAAPPTETASKKGASGEKRKVGASLVDSLGKAGTAMVRAVYILI